MVIIKGRDKEQVGYDRRRKRLAQGAITRLENGGWEEQEGNFSQ